MVWATENNLRVDPNQPSAIDLQIRVFNQRFKRVKITTVLTLVVILALIVADCLVEGANDSFRLLLWILAVALAGLLAIWGRYLGGIAEGLSREQT